MSKAKRFWIFVDEQGGCGNIRILRRNGDFSLNPIFTKKKHAEMALKNLPGYKATITEVTVFIYPKVP